MYFARDKYVLLGFYLGNKHKKECTDVDLKGRMCLI